MKKGTVLKIEKMHVKKRKNKKRKENRNKEKFFDSFYIVNARLCEKLNNVELFANFSNIFLFKINYILLRILRIDIAYIYTDVNTIWTKKEKMQDKTREKEIKKDTCNRIIQN